ncbi:MAG: phosphoenolpyruvate carboxylase, partial [Candidatus Omnitrophica bacterium]|nr:phosphoenolpyruvate carboxylase [Candidatus Omnitrophota bacterium]
MNAPKDKLAPLRRDIRMLGDVLGRVLREQGGARLFQVEETIRRLSITLRRQGRAGDERRLTRLIHQLSLPLAIRVVRAFSIYFQLVNLAEENHRIRRKRFYASLPGAPAQKGSLAALIERWRSARRSRTAIARLLDDAAVGLVLTAHPTEAQRSVVLAKHRQIFDILLSLETTRPTPEERAQQERRMHQLVTALWQTDEIRSVRPTVEEEVENGLFYLQTVLYHQLPRVLGTLEERLTGAYGRRVPVPALLRFGSWMGADMDGNPSVTSRTIVWTVRRQRRAILEQYA